MFNYQLFDNSTVNRLYNRVLKSNFFCYCITLLVNSFVFYDLNVKANLKKTIITGTQLNIVLFEMFIKPNITYEADLNNLNNMNNINNQGSKDYGLDNKVPITDSLKLIIEKHNKVIRLMKLSNESFYFYCKNSNDQLIKLVDNFQGLIKSLLK
jgi:hypothetical protein